MSVSFGVSTWIWTSPFTNDSLHLLDKIHRMGFEWVELPVEDVNLIDPYLVKEKTDELELKLICCGAFGPSRDLTHPDPKVRQNCIAYVESCLRYAQIWESPLFVGPMYAATGKARLLNPVDRKKEWNLSISGLRKICDLADKYDINIAIEPLNRFETDLVNTASRAMDLVKEVGNRRLGIMLDGFHMHIEELNMKLAIELVGEKLFHFQVSDNYRGTPGSGQTDWKGIKQGLDSIDYQGVISIEGFTPEVKELAGAVCIWENRVPSQDLFASDGLAFLQSLFDKD